MEDNISFDKWMEKMDITLLDLYFDKKELLKNKQKYHNLKSKEIIEILRLKSYSKEISDKNFIKIEYLERLLAIKKNFEDLNNEYFKLKKYVYLFFLHWFYIRYIHYYDKKKINFFINGTKVRYILSHNKIVTNHYRHLSKDKDIYINFKNFDKKTTHELKYAYDLLKDFSIEKLIIEVSKIEWIIKKRENTKTTKQINLEEIETFFKQNKLFFISMV